MEEPLLIVLYFIVDAPRLPNTLEESLKLLEEDKEMVEALGPEFIEWFVYSIYQSKSSIIPN